MAEAALGLRAHSGWAAMTGIAGPLGGPAVLLRRRIDLAAGAPGGRQPFHAAEGLPLPEAEELIRRSTALARDLARRALGDAVDEMSRAGHEVVASGLLLASRSRPLPALDRVLASHPLIHTAEGELFRDALRDAARRCEIRAIEVREKELLDQAAAALGVSVVELRGRVDALGRPLGPPWRQDEKLATLVAWLALTER